MAQAKNTTKAAETPVETELKPEPSKGIQGKQVKFSESIKLYGELSPITYAKTPQHIIKLLPNGWAAIQSKPEAIATLVPAGNILYFIPEK